jgi:hypothetical protein
MLSCRRDHAAVDSTPQEQGYSGPQEHKPLRPCKGALLIQVAPLVNHISSTALQLFVPDAGSCLCGSGCRWGLCMPAVSVACLLAGDSYASTSPQVQHHLQTDQFT